MQRYEGKLIPFHHEYKAMNGSSFYSIENAGLWMEAHSIPSRMQRYEWKLIPFHHGCSTVDGRSFHSKEHNLENGKEWSELLSPEHDMAASLMTLQQLWLSAQDLVGKISA